MKASKQTAPAKNIDSQVRIEINPWPILWTVVGAWIWFGVLHLAHIV
jgi:hypothetical protein